jgi:hypothetical protein
MCYKKILGFTACPSQSGKADIRAFASQIGWTQRMFRSKRDLIIGCTRGAHGLMISRRRDPGESAEPMRNQYTRLAAICSGLGGVAIAHFLERDAIKKEEEAKNLYRSSEETLKTLTRDLNKEREQFTTHIENAKNQIRAVYEECELRSRPIFERYGHALGNIAEWPMPPGFEKIEAIYVPPYSEMMGRVEWDQNKEKAAMGQTIERLSAMAKTMNYN